MFNVKRITGRGTLTIHGKCAIAESMYAKGKGFVAAALLLRQQEGHEYVVLHLICQGTEIVLKALLLFKNFDRYQGKLKSRFGHNLVKLINETTTTFGQNPLASPLCVEIHNLNAWYSSHRLRYGTIADVFIAPESISSDLILRRIAAVIRLAERHIHAGSTT